MNWDQLYSIIRQILLLAGGILVTKGWVDGNTMNEIVGIGMSIISSGLSLIFHMNAGQSLVAPATGGATPTGPPR